MFRKVWHTVHPLVTSDAQKAIRSDDSRRFDMALKYGKFLDIDDLLKQCILLSKINLIELCIANGIQIRYEHFVLALIHSPRSFRFFLDKNLITLNQKKLLLGYAAQSGKLEELKWLIASGAEVDCVTENNETPLFLAVKANKIECVKYLLSINANPRIQDNNGKTILHAAIGYGRNKMLKLLSSYSELLNIRDNDGNTALMLAVLEKETYQFYRLVKVGADLSVVNNLGQTAAILAGRKSTIAEYIRETHPESFMKDYVEFRNTLSNKFFYNQCEIEKLDTLPENVFTTIETRLPIKFLLVQNQIYYFSGIDKVCENLNANAAVINFVNAKFEENNILLYLSQDEFLQLIPLLNFKAPTNEQRTMSELLKISLKIIDAELDFWASNFYRVNEKSHELQFAEFVEKVGLFAAGVGDETYSRKLLRKAALLQAESTVKIADVFSKLPKGMEDMAIEFARTSSCP